MGTLTGREFEGLASSQQPTTSRVSSYARDATVHKRLDFVFYPNVMKAQKWLCMHVPKVKGDGCELSERKPENLRLGFDGK